MIIPDHLENKLNKTHHFADRIEKDEVQRNFFKQRGRGDTYISTREQFYPEYSQSEVLLSEDEQINQEIGMIRCNWLVCY